MARMPGAVWKPMPGSSTSKISSYDIFCVHTMVGSLAGTDSWFRSKASGLNSHFGVGPNGEIWQWVDTAYRSGANYSGNYHIISVECADTGAPFPAWAGSNVPAFTPAQITALGRIARWVHDTHGIPLVPIPDSRVGRKGVGYHRLGVPGYMLPGTEQWSTAQGKVCPGDRRIAQIPQVIAAALGGSQEDDLDANQAQQLDYVYTVLKGGNPNMDVLSVLYHALLDPLNSATHHGNDDDNPLGHAVSAHKYAKQLVDALAKGAPAAATVASGPAALTAQDKADIIKGVLDGLKDRLQS